MAGPTLLVTLRLPEPVESSIVPSNHKRSLYTSQHTMLRACPVYEAPAEVLMGALHHAGKGGQFHNKVAKTINK